MGVIVFTYVLQQSIYMLNISSELSNETKLRSEKKEEFYWILKMLISFACRNHITQEWVKLWWFFFNYFGAQEVEFSKK